MDSGFLVQCNHKVECVTCFVFVADVNIQCLQIDIRANNATDTLIESCYNKVQGDE